MVDFVSAKTGAQIDAGVTAGTAALPKAGGTLTGDVTTSTALSLNTVLGNAEAGKIGQATVARNFGDLDTILTAGFVNVGSNVNSPLPEAGTLVISVISSAGVSQHWFSNQSQRTFFRLKQTTFGAWQEFIHSGNAASLPLSTAFAPASDNTRSLGDATGRWSEVFAGNGAINTSDAREKTEIAPFSDDEIEASKQLAKEIGTYKFLASVDEKGDLARTHIGLTVQRAAEIMTANNLDPMSYGFICFDSWDEEVEAILDSEGEAVLDADEQPTYAVTKEAGDRYGFRYDQLNQFIIAGFNARLEAAGI